jgi:class 3 adenylate cyclase
MRKHVVVVFVDIVGSTSLGERLDPESLRHYLTRYFETVSAVLWRHGATVEKFIGDAVMAVFGVPIAREDDAARALAAAVELHQAATGISAELEHDHDVPLRVRVGICGGEVFVARHADGQYAVTGDVVNTAARLQGMADPSETLVGGTIPQLVGPGGPLRPVEPLLLRGKEKPVPVWRVAPTAGVNTDQPGCSTSHVGRDEEMADLRRVAGRVIDRQDSWLVTVIGSAGIGKSRLVAEFLGECKWARILEGNCPPGLGSTFWPLAQVLAQLGDDWKAELTMLCADAREAALIGDRLGTAVGYGDYSTTSLDDITWAARRLLELLSWDRPLVVIWEDLHWADAMFIDFLDRLAVQLTSVPVLMICVSRPELLERFPMWGGGRANAVSVRLTSLSPAATNELAAELVGAVVGHGYADGTVVGAGFDRLARLSEGNPLILRQIMELSDGERSTLDNTGMHGLDPGRSVPITVQTLFEARLDRLGPADRLVCECAAVMGREFWADAARMMAGRSGVPDREWQETLDRFERLDVFRPTRLKNHGQPTHGFTHALLMETAYRNIPKRQRSNWHADVAGWLSGSHGLGRGQRSELVAFHRERAHALFVEVSRDRQEADVLAEAAATAAIEASTQCLARSDLIAAADVLGRAQRLLPAGDHRHVATCRTLVDTLCSLGQLDRAIDAVSLADTAMAGSDVWRALAPLPAAAIALHRDPTASTAAVADDVAVRALAALEGRLEPGGLLWAYELQAVAHGQNQKFGQAELAIRLACEQAKRAGDPWTERRLRCGLGEVAFWGPTPVPEAQQVCESVLPYVEADFSMTAGVLALLGGLAALAADASTANTLLGRVGRITDELQLPVARARLTQFSGLAAALAGDTERATAEYLSGADGMEPGAGAGLVLLAARALLDSGSPSRANDLLVARAVRVEPLRSDTPYFRALRGGLAGRLAASSGASGRALAWARMAVAASASVDNPRLHGDALLDLADVLRRLGDQPAADEYAARAVDRFYAKGARRCVELAVARFPGALPTKVEHGDEF